MNVIGIDLGGTKIAAAVVNEKGKILEEVRVPTDARHWSSLKKQLLQICKSFSSRHIIRAIGIGSAGPLHAPSGKLLDPTNFGWTSPLTVPITRELNRSLKKPVLLENDAAAAALAEFWKGGGKPNSLILTLGTGLGMGVIVNGKLLRGGRELHPEGGHLILRPGDPSAPCGCGNLGCAEAYLSGKNFAKRVSLTLQKNLTGEEIVKRALNTDVVFLPFFDEYAELLALYLHNLIVNYYPQEVIFSGSFAAAFPLFQKRTETKLRSLLERRLKTLPLFPKLKTSKLSNHAGVLGAAYIALHPHYDK